MVASASHSYLPAYKKFGANVKIVHFIGADKPWMGEGAAAYAGAVAELARFLTPRLLRPTRSRQRAQDQHV